MFFFFFFNIHKCDTAGNRDIDFWRSLFKPRTLPSPGTQMVWEQEDRLFLGNAFHGENYDDPPRIVIVFITLHLLRVVSFALKTFTTFPLDLIRLL